MSVSSLNILDIIILIVTSLPFTLVFTYLEIRILSFLPRDSVQMFSELLPRIIFILKLNSFLSDNLFSKKKNPSFCAVEVEVCFGDSASIECNWFVFNL